MCSLRFQLIISTNIFLRRISWTKHNKQFQLSSPYIILLEMGPPKMHPVNIWPPDEAILNADIGRNVFRVVRNAQTVWMQFGDLAIWHCSQSAGTTWNSRGLWGTGSGNNPNSSIWLSQHYVLFYKELNNF